MRLRMTGRQHAELSEHLLAADGMEAVSVALCGRRGGDACSVHELWHMPYDRCKRQAGSITWSPTDIEPLLRRAAKENLALLKIHSHPGGYASFSPTDDESDRWLFASVFGWVDDDAPHLSAIMLPDGRVFAREVRVGGVLAPAELVSVAGDEILFWPHKEVLDVPEHAKRHAQAFGAGTTSVIRGLTVGVVGCSGTGSVLVELLARLGVGELVLVDPDRVEEKNLNRILGSSFADASEARLKVDVMGRVVASMGIGTKVTKVPARLQTAEAIDAVARCDVVFGAVDTLAGRSVLNRLSRYYCIPYFDVGVKLEARGDGSVDQVAGAVHYLQPDGSTLLDRGVFTQKRLEAENLKDEDPNAYEERLARGYIVGIDEDRPAVISVNMLFASLAVNEFLARIHPYRTETNSEFATQQISLTNTLWIREAEAGGQQSQSSQVGRGDSMPPLGMPSLSAKP